MPTTYGAGTAVAGGTNHAANPLRISFTIQNVDVIPITVEFDALGTGIAGIVLSRGTILGAGDGGAMNVNRHLGALKVFGANARYRWVEVSR